MLAQRMKKQRRTRHLLPGAVFLLLILLGVLLGPLLWHTSRILTAERNYDLTSLQEQVQWVQDHGGIFKNLPIYNDADMWLRLNLGEFNGLNKELSPYSDDKHIFWLFLADLQEGHYSDAEKVMARLNLPSRRLLADGLLAMAQGSMAKAQSDFNKPDSTWEGLNKQEEMLKSLASVWLAIQNGDKEEAEAEIAQVSTLEPENPAYLDTAFNLALWTQQWSMADEISTSIDKQSWRSPTKIYLTEKAFLDLQEKNMKSMNDVIDKIRVLPGSSPYVAYINGMLAYSQGDQAKGRELLEKALQNGLDAAPKLDTLEVLAQIQARSKADKDIQTILAGNGD